MIASSTSTENNAPRASDVGQLRTQPSKHNGKLVEIDTTSHGINDTFWLLKDLLAHEMREVSLLDLGQFLFESLDRSNARHVVISSQSMNMQFTVLDMSNIIIFEVQDLFRMLNNSRGVGCKNVLHGLGNAFISKETAGLGSTDALQ
jgi:hypothetical protein